MSWKRSSSLLAALWLLSSFVCFGAETTYGVRILIHNTSANSTAYRLVQGSGSTLYSSSLGPDESYLFTSSTLPSGENVDVQTYVDGVARIGSSYVVGPGSSFLTVGSALTTPSDAGDPFTVTVPIGGPSGPLSEGKKTIWAVTDSTLTADLFREGNDKIIAAVNASGGGSGGGSGTVSESNATGLKADSQFGEAAAKSLLGNLTSNSTITSVVVASNSTATSGKTALTGALGNIVALPTGLSGWDYGVPAPSSAYIELDSGAGIVKLFKNPFSSDGPFDGLIGLAAVLIRRIIAWGVVSAFFIYVLGELRTSFADALKTPALGDTLASSINSIRILGFGGGFGFAARVGLLVAVGALLITIPPALLASVTSGLPWAGLRAMLEAGPYGEGTPASLDAAIALTNQVIPWALLLTMPLYYAVVRFVILPGQFFWMLIVKLLPS